MRIVAIVNQKGGCGKTTTAINLAGALASRGLRTLLVDLDPQSHCAVGLGVPEDKIDLHIGDAMLSMPRGRFDDSRLLWKIGKNLELAPAAVRLAALEAAKGGLADAEDRDRRLLQFLERLAPKYDWCLVDCPPSIGLLTYNALRAADEAIIPVETSFFAMKGADRQVKTIKALARRLGGQTPFRILPTMHDPESSLAKELLDELEKQFAERVLPVVVRLDRKIKEAATFGQPVAEYAPESVGALDHRKLADFLIDNPPGRRPAKHAPGAADADGAPEVEAKPDGGPDGTEELAPAAVGSAVGAATEAPTSAEPLSPGGRAADVALRAQRMMARVSEIQARLDAERDAEAALRPSSPAPPARSGPLELIADEPATPSELQGRPNLAHLYGCRETSRGVLFVQPAAPGRRICIAGAFNRWSDSATPMRYNAALGVYETCVEMPVGRNEYRLVVDGAWMSDPHNRNTTVNPFGELNSVVVVTRRRTESALCEGAD